MKWKKVILGLMGAAIFVAGTGQAAAAVYKYEPVTGAEISFDKYLVMDQEANVPNQTFQFTIEPGAGVATEDSRLRVQGGDADSVSGQPTIARDQAKFQVGDPTYTTPQDLTANGTQAATQKKDPVQLEKGQKYAKKAVKVDFSKVSFSEPGVFRWKITEEAVQAPGITNDAELTRYLDVYVIDQEGTLVVQGYVLHKDAAFTPLTQGTTAEPTAGKSIGFINQYETYDLTLSKTVTGNQGSRDQYFKFTVALNSGTKGTVFDVDLSKADAVTGTNPYSPEAHKNPASLTTNAEGKVEATFWLQHGQTIRILGMPKGTSYTITEDAGEYRPQVKLTEGKESRTIKKAVAEDTSMEADTTAAFTNDKTGIIPTGLQTHLTLYLGIMGAGLLGLVWFFLRRVHARK